MKASEEFREASTASVIPITLDFRHPLSCAIHREKEEFPTARPYIVRSKEEKPPIVSRNLAGEADRVLRQPFKYQLVPKSTAAQVDFCRIAIHFLQLAAGYYTITTNCHCMAPFTGAFKP